MKIVGILTMYYKSHNYGGLLQAYALQKKISNYGIKCEQICFFPRKKRKIGFIGKEFLFKILQAINYRKVYSNEKIWKNLMLRDRVLEAFGEKVIPHSKNEYNEKTIIDTNKKYSKFIVGSDQVWNGAYPIYYMDFVSEENTKIAYAASISKDVLSEFEIEKFKEILPSYKFISVREAEAVSLLQPLINDKEVFQVVDPTLLLSVDEWNEIAKKRTINGPYLFCYFLGNDYKLRELASEYARRKNLIIVTLPYLATAINDSDVGFGDQKLYDVSPEEFVGLISGADSVFTDSFHASVFSCIYGRPFFAFSRKGKEKMNSRLKSLTNLFDCPNAFIELVDTITVDDLLNCSGYIINPQKYLLLKNSSEEYLRKVLDIE